MSSSPQAYSVTPFPVRHAVTPPKELREDAQRLIGPSPAMSRLWAQIRLLAPHFRTALLTGEAGSGADAVAQALHDLSPLAGTPLVRVRAVDADRQLRHTSSLFGSSNRGTLFLTDLDRLSSSSQQVLLRLLKLRRHRRIAVIATTNVDLRPLVSAGTFNTELFANIGSLRLQVPSLRERVQDIPLLTHQFLQAEATRQGCEIPQLDPGLLTAATEYSWPGNLDQLCGVVAWLLEHREGPLTSADLHEAIAERRADAEPEDAPIRMVPLDHVVQEHVRAVLIGCNGNKLRAAEVLGISRSTLYRMLDAASVAGGASPLALLAS
ncbi:MAG TPA: sigma 54-interacting transcriptional regulator [Acidobacteriaceae bacterium]|jgi:DNA-binding NtrC family response regulator